MKESSFSLCRFDSWTTGPCHVSLDSVSDPSQVLTLDLGAPIASVARPDVIHGLWTDAVSRVWGEFKATLPESDAIDVCTKPLPLFSVPVQRHAFGLIEQIDADISEPVRDYLERHPGVLAFLPEVAQEVDRYFDADPTHRLRLELLEDPDADQSELFVVVESSLDAEMAGQCLDRLLEDWFVDQAMVRAGRLAIVTEPLSTDE